jgi:hypothetical protein
VTNRDIRATNVDIRDETRLRIAAAAAREEDERRHEEATDR